MYSDVHSEHICGYGVEVNKMSMLTFLLSTSWAPCYQHINKQLPNVNLYYVWDGGTKLLNMSTVVGEFNLETIEMYSPLE